MGSMVTFTSNGGTASGYLASPASGKGSGVIVIQEWWGLIDQVKRVADMLSREGFNALAPDFYHGKSAQIGEPDAAQKLMMELDIAEAAKDARGAALYLASHPGTASTKVGVIGFCMGGMLAIMTGTVASDAVGAVVDCYGVPPQKKPDYARLRGIPMLGIFAGKDEWVMNALPTLEADLAAAGVPFEKVVYPNADHAFLNEQRSDVHRPDDAKDAWPKIISFLKRHLAG
ncbi:MAG TPA: dienelactone hydrolase family protein [Candidatus Limnocylindria bacterium]|nr:dienelactone hydrolase family protein [Candidatus Limnocylindria bacterium]